MRERIWRELTESKHHHVYSTLLIGEQRKILKVFNIAILVFSGGGVMGWSIWKEVPIVACGIVALISILKLISPHIVPSEKQIDKLDQVVDFYCDYFNKMEQLWYDHYNSRIEDQEAQNRFYQLKDTERNINKVVNEIVKGTNKKILAKTETEANNYFSRTFNT